MDMSGCLACPDIFSWRINGGKLPTRLFYNPSMEKKVNGNIHLLLLIMHRLHFIWLVFLTKKTFKIYYSNEGKS